MDIRPHDYIEYVMEDFAEFLSAARGSEPVGEYEKKANFKALLRQLLFMSYTSTRMLCV